MCTINMCVDAAEGLTMEWTSVTMVNLSSVLLLPQTETEQLSSLHRKTSPICGVELVSLSVSVGGHTFL